MDPVAFAVPATFVRADVPHLCAQLTDLLAGRSGGVVICDVAGVSRADLVTVEVLARLRLTAGRLGWTLTVHGAGPRLRELIARLALAEAIPQASAKTEVSPQASAKTGALPQVTGEAEVREQPLGVEERVDRGDPAV